MDASPSLLEIINDLATPIQVIGEGQHDVVERVVPTGKADDLIGYQFEKCLEPLPTSADLQHVFRFLSGNEFDSGVIGPQRHPVAEVFRTSWEWRVFVVAIDSICGG